MDRLEKGQATTRSLSAALSGAAVACAQVYTRVSTGGHDGYDPHGHGGREERPPPPSNLLPESLDYESTENDVFRAEHYHHSSQRHFYGYTGLTIAKYLLTIFIGAFTGSLAYLMQTSVKTGFEWKVRLRQAKPSQAKAESPVEAVSALHGCRTGCFLDRTAS